MAVRRKSTNDFYQVKLNIRIFIAIGMLAIGLLVVMVPVAWAPIAWTEDAATVRLSLKDHRFQPAEARAPAAHAGEEGPAKYVRDALDLLHVARIDHGNHALDDPALIERLARKRVPLTVCPLSNVRLRVVDDIYRHPLRTMMDKGLFVTVNSDDPAYFGGYVNENYLAVQQALGLSEDDLAQLARNSRPRASGTTYCGCSKRHLHTMVSTSAPAASRNSPRKSVGR